MKNQGRLAGGSNAKLGQSLQQTMLLSPFSFHTCCGEGGELCEPDGASHPGFPESKAMAEPLLTVRRQPETAE